MLRKLVVVLLTGVMCLVGVTSALAVKLIMPNKTQIKLTRGEV